MDHDQAIQECKKIESDCNSHIVEYERARVEASARAGFFANLKSRGNVVVSLLANGSLYMALFGTKGVKLACALTAIAASATAVATCQYGAGEYDEKAARYLEKSDNFKSLEQEVRLYREYVLQSQSSHKSRILDFKYKYTNLIEPSITFF